jgi:hypothetical protein
MKSINIEILMGHSIGISDSYYRIPEKELIGDYLKAVKLLTIGENNILRHQLTEPSDNETGSNKRELQKELQLSTDPIASLSDQILKMQREIEILKNVIYPITQ